MTAQNRPPDETAKPDSFDPDYRESDRNAIHKAYWALQARQCDKENHGWREGPPLTESWLEFRSVESLHPPGIFNSNEKRILPSAAIRKRIDFEDGRYKPPPWLGGGARRTPAACGSRSVVACANRVRGKAPSFDAPFVAAAEAKPLDTSGLR
jgi:hypothetical protein